MLVWWGGVGELANQDPCASHTIRLQFYGQESLALSPLFYHLDLSNNSEP